MKNKVFILSVVINVLLILIVSYGIYKNGGLDYLKAKFSLRTETVYKQNVYYKTKQSIFNIMPNSLEEIIFLGNSIFDYCDWHEFFRNKNIKNRGIDGDIINGIIDRLDEVIVSEPAKIFLMIGINDLARNRTIEEIISDYDRLISLICQRSPGTEIFILSILPTDNRSNLQNTHIAEINKGLANIAGKYKQNYINIFDLLLSKEQTLDTAYTFDGLHLNGKGYLILKKAIENYVND